MRFLRIFRRFDPDEPITDGVETLMDLCEIRVDVAEVDNDVWALKEGENVQRHLSGEFCCFISSFSHFFLSTYPLCPFHNPHTAFHFHFILHCILFQHG